MGGGNTRIFLGRENILDFAGELGMDEARSRKEQVEWKESKRGDR